MGSPPQMETTGAPQSSMAARHCSTVSISLIVDLYSRMRPQPVQVRLQACSGSSIITMGNFFVAAHALAGDVLAPNSRSSSADISSIPSCGAAGARALPGESRKRGTRGALQQVAISRNAYSGK